MHHLHKGRFDNQNMFILLLKYLRCQDYLKLEVSGGVMDPIKQQYLFSVVLIFNNDSNQFFLTNISSSSSALNKAINVFCLSFPFSSDDDSSLYFSVSLLHGYTHTTRNKHTSYYVHLAYLFVRHPESD